MDDLQKKRQLTWPEFLLIKGRFALLEAIIAPQFLRTRGSYGPLTACKSNLKNIGTAMEMYSSDNSGKYPPNIDMLTPNYLKTIPECPASARVTYKYYGGQGPANNPGFQDYYYVECHGENHTHVSIKGHYPAYDGISGLIERPESMR